MPLNISWLHKGRVILAKADQNLEPNDLIIGDKQFIEMIHKKAPDASMVHILVDLRGTVTPALGVQDTTRIFTHLREPDLGWTLLITDNRIVQFETSVATQLAKARFRPFNDFDEAYAFLKQQDQSLAALEKTD